MGVMESVTELFFISMPVFSKAAGLYIFILYFADLVN